MAKYKGKDLSLKVDGDELKLEATSIVLQPEDGEQDALTFGELNDGDTSQWYFTINAISDYGDGSFWTWCWENNGEEAAYIFDPYGVGATPTTSKPHFVGLVTVPTPPQIGGTAGETFAFEIRMDCTARPERKTSA